MLNSAQGVTLPTHWTLPAHDHDAADECRAAPDRAPGPGPDWSAGRGRHRHLARSGPDFVADQLLRRVLPGELRDGQSRVAQAVGAVQVPAIE